MPEEILYEAHPPMFRNHPLGFAVSVLLCPIVVGIIILIVWYIRVRSETLTITNEELHYETGFLSKSRSEVRLTSIRSVRVHQSLMERIFGTGDIEVFTAGDQPEVTVRGMPNPDRVRELIGEHS
ncbi:MAG TPA: PH domain-containing protein [Gammaproteobacteria bacterium]|nr:PH domain-containing protein [Gammaproteobacteria bacterium]